VSWEEGVCGRDLITVDEDEGCINFEENADLLEDDEDLDWEEDQEVEEVDFFDEDDGWEREEEEEEEPDKRSQRDEYEL